MKEIRYTFAGNRASVLQKMIELNLNVVKIWAVDNSYLQRFLDEKGIPYTLIKDKGTFIEEIKQESFDYFISNGLPIILPIDELKTENKEFINIHPSLLPDLRGKDPVPGALLFGRSIGTTCHYMDNGIDSGDIIAQVEIENTSDLEAGLLYQLSFIAEAEVFEKAFRKEFASEGRQEINGDEIYYSFREEDLRIDLEEDSIEAINAKVKAFDTRNKGAYFVYDNKRYRCTNVEKVVNKYLIHTMGSRPDYSCVMMYENKIIYKRRETYLKLTVLAETH